MKGVIKLGLLAAAAFLFGGYAQKKWGTYDKTEDTAKNVYQKGKEQFDKFKNKAEEVVEEAKETVEETVNDGVEE